MLNRLVSSVLILGLLTATATAGDFAQPPPPPHPEAVQSELPVPPSDAAPVVVTRAKVRAALRAKRAQSLALFRAYWRAGVYPHNTLTDGALNIWLDADNHLCAAATVISGSGFASEVLQQAADDNFIQLKDVDDGWLADWMLTSGLTREELVLIQRPFVGRPLPEQLAPSPPANPFAAIDARMRRKYVAIDRTLAKHTRRSLEIAVTRLMANPTLAAALLTES